MHLNAHVTCFGIAMLAVSSLAQELFHGTSMILIPNHETGHPKDTEVQTSSFYCFITPHGYLSFGWWLGNNSHHLNFRPVRPDPALGAFDWFETSNGTCTKPPCRYHARNFQVHNNKSEIAFEDDYVVEPFQLGPEEHSMMALSYFDRSGGASAVGVRTQLHAGSECDAAYATLQDIKKTNGLELAFELTDPCNLGHGVKSTLQGGLQKLLGVDL